MKTVNGQSSMVNPLAIIISYNFMPWIDRCLPSLLSSSVPMDILVIDNGSTDDTLTTLQERYPQVQVIANGKNLGFGAANNIGMQIAMDKGYDGVILINQDAWLEADTLQQLIDACQQHPEYGIVSPKHLTGDGSKLDPGFECYIGSGEDAVGGDSQSSILDCQFINAALWYIPADVIKKVGMFAPLFYHYGEDKDYVNRLHYHGYRIGYVPTAIGYHDRAERPFSRERWLRTENVYHLSEYANINYSFPKAFALGVLAPIKKAWKALLKGKGCDFIDYLDMSIRLLMHTYIVCKTRKQAKI